MHKSISAAVFVMMLFPILARAATALEAAEEAFLRGDYAAAMPFLKAAGERGNRIAAETLGDMYWYGEALYGPAVPRDRTAALDWFRRAAREGSAFAAHMLSEIDHEARQAQAR